MRRYILAVPALLLSAALSAQNATLKRGSNLRKAPNTNSDILQKLQAGDSVSLISSAKRLGYY
ncbi:MAG TPA: hypothetical protein VG498_04700, partial [Terriglobales bacterium]|nr:hypothetical protein [Terriglobales bacterium]